MDEAKDEVSAGESVLDDARSGSGLPNTRCPRATRKATGWTWAKSERARVLREYIV